MDKLVSKNCVNFVKSFEGFSPIPYFDIVGVKTLGYGMTGKEIEGLKSVTEVQASNMLEDLLNINYALPIKNNLDIKHVTLSQNQFDAIVSMAYNIGLGGLLGSSLYKNICNGSVDRNLIISNFRVWSKAGGKTVAGLLRRRTEEAAMFFSTSNILEEETEMIDFTVEQKARQQAFKVPNNNNVVPKGDNITPLNGGGWIERVKDGRVITHLSRVTYYTLHSNGSMTLTHCGEVRNI